MLPVSNGYRYVDSLTPLQCLLAITVTPYECCLFTEVIVPLSTFLPSRRYGASYRRYVASYRRYGASYRRYGASYRRYGASFPQLRCFFAAITVLLCSHYGASLPPLRCFSFWLTSSKAIVHGKFNIRVWKEILSFYYRSSIFQKLNNIHLNS